MSAHAPPPSCFIDQHDDPEEASEHDQLPSVDEAKANVAHSNGPSRTKCYLVVGAIVVVILGAAVAIAAAVTSANEESIALDGNELRPMVPSDAAQPVFTEVPVVEQQPPVQQQPEQQEDQPIVEEPIFQTVADEDRLDKLIEYLVNNGISSEQDLSTDGTAQRVAAVWVAEKDERKVSFENIDALLQRYALGVFYHALNGESWSHRLGFLSDESECNWNSMLWGSRVGVTCFDNEKVHKIEMPNLQLTGQVPEELRVLTVMEEIDLSINKRLTGDFPLFVRHLPSIKKVALHYCGFSGEVPKWLGDVTTLDTLTLSNNEFKGQIPLTLGQLSMLEYIYLDDNIFTGSLNAFSPLTNLKHLIVEDNMFDANLEDTSLWGKWNNLILFDASHNSINSKVPTEIFALPNLEVLDLHQNEIFGALPEVHGFNNKMRFLALNDNSLSGAIPPSLSQFIHMQHLDLSNNHFQSLIPEDLGGLTEIEYFFLAGNSQLDPAPIPPFISKLTTLKDLSLKDTNRESTIPAWIGALAQISLLDLADNKLTGVLPEAFPSSLRHLLLNRNQLELQGSLPATMEGLTNLETLLLDKNNFSGATIDGICKLEDTLKTVIADCGGEAPPVACSCCTTCCVPGDDSCNDKIWLGDLNPIWELGYDRKNHYQFDADPNQSYKVTIQDVKAP